MDEAISSLPTPALVDAITELAGHLNAAQARFLALLAELDRRNAWAEWGVRSCAHWLNWKCGLNLGAAREKIRVARALERLPRIAAAMAAGQLSYAKVRPMTRAADEATEEYFLQIALHGTAHHVERLARGFRRVKEAQELSREEQQQQRRCLSCWYDDDGSLLIRGRLPAEAGAALLKALQFAEESIPLPPKENVSAETFLERAPTAATRRADALRLIAEGHLAAAQQGNSGGDRTQIVVHVDAATLQRDEPGRCELDEGPAIAAETARRLACDASLVTIVENGDGEPLNVGRKTRTIPPALRRALQSRDQGCRFPGCTHTRFVDGHHLRHWAHGGETKLGNLVSLCRFHHRLVHEGRIAVAVLDDGAVRFQRSGRRPIDSPLRDGSGQSDWLQLVAGNRARSIAITPRTAQTRWLGERMDYGTAVDHLLWLERQHAAIG
ncbi:MAG: DUF222 domain-containing protein [Gammaproteobacteria bacterium]|nr:DUF222 domain-containing protein [Gammaproteobacteria bacterium]